MARVEMKKPREVLPALIEAAHTIPRERPALRSAFLSHLLAQGQAGGAQGESRAPVDEALEAYAAGSKRLVRRMPSGYRTSVII